MIADGNIGNSMLSWRDFTCRTRELSALVSVLNYDGLSFVDRLAGRE